MEKAAAGAAGRSFSAQEHQVHDKELKEFFFKKKINKIVGGIILAIDQFIELQHLRRTVSSRQQNSAAKSKPRGHHGRCQMVSHAERQSQTAATET